MIATKSAQELSLMRDAGRVVAEVLAAMADTAKPGVSTAELDEVAEGIILKNRAVPAFKGYPHGGRNEFPASICTSINEEIVHGIPDRQRILQDGDILSVDVGAVRGGFYGDAATTLAIGEVDEASRRLLAVTEGALKAGIDECFQGNHLWNVIRAIQVYVESRGFNVLREYQGHGIGRKMHEEPGIPNYLGGRGQRPKNYPLVSGMTLALEPMVVVSDWRTRVLSDGWTVVTADGKRSAHFEHTIAVADGRAEVLTRL